jgi:hypothetical protein
MRSILYRKELAGVTVPLIHLLGALAQYFVREITHLPSRGCQQVELTWEDPPGSSSWSHCAASKLIRGACVAFCTGKN